jgi:hypothetical protein
MPRNVVQLSIAPLKAASVGVPATDLRGVNRLTIAAIAGIVDIVEAMHHKTAILSRIVARPKQGGTTGITRLVYRSIQNVVGLVGNGLDSLLARLAPLLGDRSTWPGRDAVLAALNGVLGDYLAATNNPLALTMCLRRGGIELPRGEPLAARSRDHGSWSAAARYLPERPAVEAQEARS